MRERIGRFDCSGSYVFIGAGDIIIPLAIGDGIVVGFFFFFIAFIEPIGIGLIDAIGDTVDMGEGIPDGNGDACCASATAVAP